PLMLGIHWGTFRLSKEPMDEPMHRLIAAAGPEVNRVAIRQIGVAWTLPAAARQDVNHGTGSIKLDASK
ncbi:MAG: hypothetical protein ACXWML_06410, partial [Candidatus Binataceae bacterium]